MPTDLSAAVLGSTGRDQTLLPQGLDQVSVTALLESCDRLDPIGRRDYAVLVTLLRLGLRAGEVARLGLRDINWRTGEIVVHGKGRRIDRLPLPADVVLRSADTSRTGALPAPIRRCSCAPWPRSVAWAEAGSRASSVAPAGEPASHRSARTACVIRPLARWSPPVFRWRRSGRPCAIAAASPRPATPASTWRRCGAWPRHGPPPGQVIERE